jgi:chromate transporter
MSTVNEPVTGPIKKSSILWQLAGIFLKIGSITFGGPMALIAIMEQEFVSKRPWLTHEHFMDLMAATNLVPGPNACEMAGLIGYQRAKWSGLVVAELAFIIPSVVISSLIAILYVRFGSLPQVSAIFYGINPVIVALILFATWRLGKRTLVSYVPVVIFGMALLAVILGVNEVLIIFGAGFLGMLLNGLPKLKDGRFGLISIIPILHLGSLSPLTSASSDNILLKLFLLFLKTGSLIFGSGLVLFAFIQSDIVGRLGWLTQQQLIDAIAVGQMTPGPVSSSAAFIGYLIAGWPGMLVASIGIFLPSFIIVSIIGPIIPKMRESLCLQAFLKGVTAAVLALMLAVGLTIAKSAIVDPWTLLILIASGVLLLWLKVDSFWLVLGGAVIGLLRFLL